mgnify:CR=1 FL=1|jgi:hypothetical protein
MAISPSAVTANANSKLVAISLIATRVDLTPAQRMARIAVLSDEFRGAVTGSTADPFRDLPDRSELVSAPGKVGDA